MTKLHTIARAEESKGLPVLILAGGRGTRLGAACDQCPKPLIPVDGVPFVEHVIRFLEQEAVGVIYLLTGYRGEQIAAYYRDRLVKGHPVVCIREDKPLGTGGAVRHALDAAGIDGRFLLLNGDSFTPFPVGGLVACADGADGALIGVRVRNTSRYGTLKVTPQGALAGFLEKRPGSGCGLVNAGIYCLHSGRFSGLEAGDSYSIETDLFPAWLAAGLRLGVLPVEGPFLDIGTPESLSRAGAFVAGLKCWNRPASG